MLDNSENEVPNRVALVVVGSLLAVALPVVVGCHENKLPMNQLFSVNLFFWEVGSIGILVSVEFLPVFFDAGSVAYRLCLGTLGLLWEVSWASLGVFRSYFGVIAATLRREIMYVNWSKRCMDRQETIGDCSSTSPSRWDERQFVKILSEKNGASRTG